MYTKELPYNIDLVLLSINQINFANVWLTSKRNEQRNASTVFMNECWNEADCIPIISGKRNLVLRFDRMMFSSLSNDLKCE